MDIVKSSFEIKSCLEDGCFTGYASVFGNTDLHDDIVMPGAFASTLRSDPLPKMLWQHEPHQPIGIWENIYEDAKGLYVKGRLMLGLRAGREAYRLLKDGVVDGLSIGYYPKKVKKYGAARVLEDVELHEISLVTFAANPLARVISVKAFEISDYIKRLMHRIQDMQSFLSVFGNERFA